MNAVAKPAAGLLTTAAQPIPLLGVQVEAEIRGAQSRVVLRQRYRNAEAVPVEAVYVFPVPEAAALCGLTVVIGERRIEARVEEREKAFAAYDDALQAGHGAVLLDQERPNVLTLSVGNLLPDQEIAVELEWVAELGREGDALRFALPTTVAPRYAPAEDLQGVSPTPAERLSPPVGLEVPYGFSFAASVELPGGLARRGVAVTPGPRRPRRRARPGRAGRGPDRDGPRPRAARHAARGRAPARHARAAAERRAGGGGDVPPGRGGGPPAAPRDHLPGRPLRVHERQLDRGGQARAAALPAQPAGRRPLRHRRLRVELREPVRCLPALRPDQPRRGVTARRRDAGRHGRHRDPAGAAGGADPPRRTGPRAARRAPHRRRGHQRAGGHRPCRGARRHRGDLHLRHRLRRVASTWCGRSPGRAAAPAR